MTERRERKAADAPEGRATLYPTFDMEQYARDSDESIRNADAAPLSAMTAEPHGGPSLEVNEEVSDQEAAQVYWARLGASDQVVVLTQPLEELMQAPRAPMDGFILWRVDGRRTVGAVVELSELPVVEALLALCDLLERGVIALRSPP